MARDEAYHEAEKKIEEALKSGATELDLSNFQYQNPKPPQLTELPDSLWQLTQLTKLNLSSNQLRTLPQSLGQLTQLTELNLSSTHLMSLPDSLGQLTQLTELDLSHNQLATLPESLAALGALTQLAQLNLSSNQLANLPESLAALGTLTQLTELNLSHNQLRTLPGSITKLENLQRLELFDNRILKFPPSISNISQLEEIDCGGNDLSVVPAELEKLHWLKKLKLNQNEIQVLPEWLGKFHFLEELVLFANLLSDLPRSLAQLEQLRKLDLRTNPLNPILQIAYDTGLDTVKAYLRGEFTLDTVIKSTYKRKLKVFLCHASQDKPSVHELHEKLLLEGWIEPWLDVKKLLPGQDWQAEIRNAVEKADNVIIFLSNISINKDGFIQKELRLAKDIALEKTEGSIFLIPLRLDACEVPRSLQIYHWANYFGTEKEQTYSKLLETLKLRLEEIKRKEVYTK